MPPKKPEVQVEYEKRLASLIRERREAADWSLDALAAKMKDHGCQIDRSAIFRIEKAERRITLNEAMTFARILDVDLEDLLLPEGIAKSREARRLYKKYIVVEQRWHAALEEMEQIQLELLRIAGDGFENVVLDALHQLGAVDYRLKDGGVVTLLDEWRVTTLADQVEAHLEQVREREDG